MVGASVKMGLEPGKLRVRIGLGREQSADRLDPVLAAITPSFVTGLDGRRVAACVM